ncbi:MAG TPA: hypothetical protein VNE71_05235 [Myxococcota bacterium]|nr:hypothetical protein [Myxococcota bacterium]
MRLALVIALAACGAPEPRPDAAPSCADIGLHFVALAELENGAPAPEDLAAGIRNETERRCREESWSDARRTCLHKASTEDAMLACPAQ